VIAGAARWSARSGWAEVKALDGAPRPRTKSATEGKAECLRVVEIAQRYDLDPPIQWDATDGAELKEFERSEHQFRISGIVPIEV